MAAKKIKIAVKGKKGPAKKPGKMPKPTSQPSPDPMGMIPGKMPPMVARGR